MFPTQASVAIVTGIISNFISFYIRPLGTVTREKSLGQGLGVKTRDPLDSVNSVNSVTR